MRNSVWMIILLSILAAACAKPAEAPRSQAVLFEDDIEFLAKHTKVVVLSDKEGNARVAVNPDLQGRVMTSTAGGPDGPSFGWINRELIASGVNNVHMNAFGGEDRFWLGPEGGQFSIFFKKGDPVRPRPLVHPARRQRGLLRHRFPGGRSRPLQEGHSPGQLFRRRLRPGRRSRGRTPRRA